MIAPVEPPAESGQQPSIKWITPIEAISEFADKSLMGAAMKAFEEMKSLNAGREKLNGKPPHQFTADDKAIFAKAYECEVAFYRARSRVLDNLIEQLAKGLLVGRAVPFENKKLIENNDRELIKASHWTAIKFEIADSTLETINEGKQTYTSLQIGKLS